MAPQKELREFIYINELLTKWGKQGLGESLLVDRDFKMRANTNHALCV